MRPGVISTDRDPAAGTAFDGEDQSIVVGRSAGIDVRNRSEELTGRCILQTQTAALVGIGCRGTCGVAGTVERAWRGAKVHGRINFLCRPHMNGVVAEIGGGHKPVHADLLLQAEVPLIYLHVGGVVVRCGNDGIGWPNGAGPRDVSAVREREWVSA